MRLGLALVCAIVSNKGPMDFNAVSRCANPSACPLSQVRAGTSVRIKQLSAPPDVTHRLREMGFCEEQKIKLLMQNTNVICQVCNVRLGISAELAENIMVGPIARDRAA